MNRREVERGTIYIFFLGERKSRERKEIVKRRTYGRCNWEEYREEEEERKKERKKEK